MIPEGKFLKKAFCVGVDSSLDAFLSVCAGFFSGYGFLWWGLVVIGNVFKFVPIVAIRGRGSLSKLPEDQFPPSF